MAHVFEAPVTIVMPYGRIIIGDAISKNGIRIISDVEDPPELVFESREGGGLGKLTWARHRADGNREEVAIEQGKIDESRPGTLSGERTLHVRDHTKPGDGMVLRETVRSHGPVGSVTASRFYSDDRRYCFNVQGDDGGKIVQYDTHFSADESTWTAVGQFRSDPL